MNAEENKAIKDYLNSSPSIHIGDETFGKLDLIAVNLKTGVAGEGRLKAIMHQLAMILPVERVYSLTNTSKLVKDFFDYDISVVLVVKWEYSTNSLGFSLLPMPIYHQNLKLPELSLFEDLNELLKTMNNIIHVKRTDHLKSVPRPAMFRPIPPTI